MVDLELNRCKTCKHWTRNTEAYDQPSAGVCKHPKMTSNERTVPVDGINTWDHEDYSSGFESGEDFGCIHWLGAKQDSQAAGTREGT